VYGFLNRVVRFRAELSGALYGCCCQVRENGAFGHSKKQIEPSTVFNELKQGKAAPFVLTTEWGSIRMSCISSTRKGALRSAKMTDCAFVAVHRNLTKPFSGRGGAFGQVRISFSGTTAVARVR
jgi:hypothetical protein